VLPPSRRAALILQDREPGVVVGDVHDRVGVDEDVAALDDPGPTAAGFAGFEVLAIDNPFWRFYRLRG
jgi:hypothetical protein